MALLKRAVSLLPRLHKFTPKKWIFQNHIRASGAPVAMNCSSVPNYEEDRERALKAMKIRSARRTDMKMIADMWQSEGIEVCDHHLGKICEHLCSEGFFVAELDGEFIGAIISIPLSDTWALQGCFITTPEARHRHLGGHILRDALKFLGPDRNIIADAVPDMVETYVRYGYQHNYDHDISYSGNLNKKDSLEDGAPELEKNLQIVNLQDVNFRKIMDFDRSHHPDSLTRTNYLKWHLYDYSLGYAIMTENEEEVVAIGGRSEYMGGAYLGPIYATDNHHGELLLRKLFAEVPDGSLCRMMVPKDNLAANKLITKVGLTQDGEGIRIATKFKQEAKLDMYFGFTVAAYIGLSLC